VEEDRARELLATARARVERELSRLQRSQAEEEEDDTTDPGDTADDLLEAEIDEGLIERLREQLGSIERAEARLADGTYGRSVESGEPIPDERLEAIPWAELTAEEQARRGR